MKTNSSNNFDPVAALSLFLPSGLLDYFSFQRFSVNLLHSLSGRKITIPFKLCHLSLHSKGYLPEIEVQDFPIRGKTVYLRIKRRRWEDPTTGHTYSRDWSLVATGTRITRCFFKELLR